MLWDGALFFTHPLQVHWHWGNNGVEKVILVDLKLNAKEYVKNVLLLALKKVRELLIDVHPDKRGASQHYPY